MAKRLVAKVDEYERDGQIKGKYVEVGVILSNDNGEYALLDPSVNLAGVLQKQNMLGRKKQQQPRDMVAVSIFDNSQQQGQQQGSRRQPQQPQQPQQQKARQQPVQQSVPQKAQPTYNEPPMDFDDDIPFMDTYHRRNLLNCI